MKCDQLHQHVDLYAAAELEAGLAVELEAHAAECAECAAQVAAARGRIAALEASLDRFRADDGFVARTMARVRAQGERPEMAPLVPQITHPVLRYVAMAAAAVLFALAGYGFLQRDPAARVVRGPISRVGATSASLAPGAALSAGDVLATPVNVQEPAVMELAGGRLRAAVKPGSVIRITDARCGTIAHLARGGMLLGASGQPGCPAIATPLARVAPLRGAVSVHVLPNPGQTDPTGAFHGVVTLKAHKGWARIQLATSQRGGVVTLRPEQTLILRSGPRQASVDAKPLDYNELRERTRREIDAMEQRLNHFQREWDQVSQLVRHAPPEELPDLFLKGVQYQVQIRRAAATRDELVRRLGLLQRLNDDDPRILRAVHQER